MGSLFASSNETSFADFAKRTEIPIDDVYEKGGRLRDFRLVFGMPAGDWRDLKSQIEEAEVFLECWESELAAFAAEFSPDDFWLHFVILSRLGNAVVQNDYFPPKLISLAGRLGLSIVIAFQDPSSIAEGPDA